MVVWPMSNQSLIGLLRSPIRALGNNVHPIPVPGLQPVPKTVRISYRSQPQKKSEVQQIYIYRYDVMKRAFQHPFHYNQLMGV